MSPGHNHISIDAALNQMLGSYTSGDSGDYADFLERLAEHDKTQIPIDTVLEEKLEFQQVEHKSSWKKIIAIIWFRRVRNASLVLLLLLGLGYSLNHFIPAEKRVENPSSGMDKPVVSEDSKTDIKPHVVQENKPRTSLNIPLKNAGDHKEKIKFKDKIHQAVENRKTDDIKTGIGRDETGLSSHDENETTLQIAGLKKLMSPRIDPAESMSFILPFPVSKPPIKKPPFIKSLPNSGFIAGLNIINSFQQSHSSINQNEPRNINRNYEALSGNGRTRSHVMNYGISIEKTVFRGFGLSLGINKLSILQKQHTDFVLNEVPVFDMDGGIAGYISIAPERINSTIENRIDYVSVPFNLTYGLSLGTKTGLKFMFGTNMLGMAGRETEKFDYKSLDLKTYDNPGNRFSFGNNMQYGLSYSRHLRNNLMLSFGLERQVLNKVKELSDNMEKTRSTITNMSISLQYRL